MNTQESDLANLSPEQELQSVFKQNLELKEMVMTMAHDLKEPVQTISSFINLLKNEALVEEEKIQYMDIVDQSAKRMTARIQGLIDYALLGKKLTIKKVAVSEMLDHVCIDLQQSIKEQNAKITFPSNLPVINAYETELRSLFQNLISNAIKFIKKGTPPCVKISYSEDPLFHNFHIADNGIGIAIEKQDSIFKLFNRLNTQEDIPGTGIGLTHCKKIAQFHKGAISLKSESNKGSTFTIAINKNLNNI